MKYKKRALSILLALTMILTFMPAMAFAEGEGSASIMTLNGLPSPEDGVIKLTGDVDLTSTFIVETTDNLTLDLNGHTITSTAGDGLEVRGKLVITDTSDGKNGAIIHNGSDDAIWIRDTGDVTLEYGTIKTTWSQFGTIMNSGGSFSMSNGMLENTTPFEAYPPTNKEGITKVVLNTNGSAKVDISGGTIITTLEHNHAIALKGNTTATITGGSIIGNYWGIAAWESSILTVSGEAVIKAQTSIGNKGTAISTNGNPGEGATVNINGGTITGEDIGIYVPSGKLNVTDGNISGNTGIYFKSNSIEITGGNIYGTGTPSAYEFDGNGANSTGDALVIDSCNYPNGIDVVSITGGIFESVNAKAVSSYTKQDDPRYTGEQCKRVEEFIDGGTFSSAVTPLIVSDGVAATVTNTDGKTAYVVGEKTVQEAANAEDNAIVVTQGDIALDPETTKATVTNDGTGVVKVGDKEVNTSSEELAEMKKNAREDAEKIDALEKAKADAEKAAADTKNELDALKKSVEDEKNIEAKYAPAKVKLKKAVRGKNRITVSFKKVTKKVAGYQIRLTNTRDGKKTYITVKKSSKKTIKKTVRNLYGNTKYKVNVRAFNKVKGKRVYGKWSNTKTVKVR